MDNAISPSPEPELFLSIRFSASLPDVLLEVASPNTTTTAGLKRLIRTRLPPELSTRRLRLIHAGKALEDSTPLSTSLKLSSLPPLPSTPASSSQTPTIPDGDEEEEEHENKDKKGKTPVYNEPQPRIYIHCSIGDVTLSPSDLAAEASIASTTTATSSSKTSKTTQSHSQSADTTTSHHHEPQHDQALAPPTTTTPAPRGFDRLISAGLTDVEITALRAQFRNFQSQSRTPHTMLSAAELRDLEERWLDNTDNEPVQADDGRQGGGEAGDGDGGGSPLDDMLWGSVMGFFWPVACMIWLMREDGVWSWRKGLAVTLGVITNALLGVLRHIG